MSTAIYLPKNVLERCGIGGGGAAEATQQRAVDPAASAAAAALFEYWLQYGNRWHAYDYEPAGLGSYYSVARVDICSMWTVGIPIHFLHVPTVSMRKKDSYRN